MRSVLAVVLGYVATAVLVVLSHAATHSLPVLLAAGFVAAVAGGHVAGAVARKAPIGHAAALAAFMAVMGVVSLAMPVPEAEMAPPAWWIPTVTTIGIAGALAGGWLSARRAPALA